MLIYFLFFFTLVCEFWKLTASRQWQKIKRIGQYKRGHVVLNERVEITSDDAYRIITYAAPYVEVVDFDNLRACREFELIMFGNYCYDVVGLLTTDTIMEVLIKAHATEVSEVRFETPPTPELMTIFLKNNKVKTLEYLRSNDYYLHVPTDGIENARLLMYLQGGTPTSFNGVCIIHISVIVEVYSSFQTNT